jgi:hypothetical protein
MAEGKSEAYKRIQRVEEHRPSNYFTEEMGLEKERKIKEQRQVDVTLIIEKLNKNYGDEDFRSQMQDAIKIRDLGLLQSALDLISNKSADLQKLIRRFNKEFLLSEEDISWEQLEEIFCL